MLLVIFGAGASYDSDPSLQPGGPYNLQNDNRPPLADDLFANRQEFRNTAARFSECSAIVPYLRNIPPGTSIERRLEELQAEALDLTHRYPLRLAQLAAVRFYIQTVLEGCTERWYQQSNGITNYLTLLDEIRCRGNDRACLVTFNYDRLIENGIQKLTGEAVWDFDEYLAGPFQLFKVHGSVNWGRVVKDSGTAGVNAVEYTSRHLIANAAKIEAEPVNDIETPRAR